MEVFSLANVFVNEGLLIHASFIERLLNVPAFIVDCADFLVQYTDELCLAHVLWIYIKKLH